VAQTELQFLKLGGSLITDKKRPHTPRLEVLTRVAREIGEALHENPNLKLLIGHGSGSFGHVPARHWGTRQGVTTAEQWWGFVEVWREANQLNRLVMDAFLEAKLPVLTFSPVASVVATQGKIIQWNTQPIKKSLQVGLVPVVQGDVIFDEILGGTILSTEDLFDHLAFQLMPKRILLAGVEPGVWADYPQCTRIIPEITPQTSPELNTQIQGSAAMDVTGGMASKVRQSLVLVGKIPELEVRIFSGEESGIIKRVLLGEMTGTLIRS
jgi:isopentenyl phosphate kinase